MMIGRYVGPWPPANKAAEKAVLENKVKETTSMSKAKSILDMIRHKQKFNWIYNTVEYEEPGEPVVATQKMSADDWQEFKRKFVEEYGGEPIEPTGMTHSEFMNYIKTSGHRENSEFDGARRIRAILRKMDDDT
jgi:hypothetical protein